MDTPRDSKKNRVSTYPLPSFLPSLPPFLSFNIDGMASRVVLPRLIFIISFALQALNVLSESAQPTRNQHRRALLEQQTTGAEKDDVSLSRVERLERLRQKRHHRRHHQGSTAATLAALRDDREFSLLPTREGKEEEKWTRQSERLQRREKERMERLRLKREMEGGGGRRRRRR